MKDLFKDCWTIPNLLSLIRLLLIPVFALLFYYDYIWWSLVVLALSGISDFLDGKIARKYNQISELGKLLDPAADKLTQITLAVLFFMEFRHAEGTLFQITSWIFVIFIIKESIMLICAFIMLLKNVMPIAAKMYGKAATTAFYIVMALIIGFGPEIGIISRYFSVLTIPEPILMVLLIITAVLTLFAFVRYGIIAIKQMKSNSIEKNIEDKNDE